MTAVGERLKKFVASLGEFYLQQKDAITGLLVGFVIALVITLIYSTQKASTKATLDKATEESFIRGYNHVHDVRRISIRTIKNDSDRAGQWQEIYDPGTEVYFDSKLVGRVWKGRN